MFTEFNLYFGMVNVFLPFMILPLYSSMRMLDTRLTDAAASLGAGPVYTFTRVTLPLTMPGVIAGVSLVFAITVASYVTPSLLIGDRYMTMSQVMAKAYLNIRDFQLGASMAVIMLVIATVIVVSASFLARAPERGALTMARLGMGFCWMMLILVLVFLFAPIVIVVAVSFSPSTIFSFPPDGFSWRWYEAILKADSLLSSVWLSAQIAFLATCISLTLGTLCAIAVVRGLVPAGKAIATFMASPLMLPGLVLGIAFLQAARGAGLRDAYTTLLIAHVVITMPFVMRTVLASLAHFDFAMVDAARTLGYSYPRALWKVLVPNILPGFVSGALFAFIASFDNYPVSIFLVDVRTKTLPIQLLNQLEMSPDPTVAAASALLILGTIVALIICDRLVGLRRMASI